MNFVYCVCGARTPQDINPVKFCSQCGKSFIGIVSKPTPVTASKPSRISTKIKRREIEREEQEIDDENEEIEEIEAEEEDVEVPRLTENPIEYQIMKPDSFKVGELAANIKVEPAQSQKIKQWSKKDVKSFLQKTGGSTKGKAGA